jgi:hypothetical protein
MHFDKVGQTREKAMTIVQSAKRFIDKRYDAALEAKCNTCNVGAWFISREHHLYKKRGTILKGFINPFRSKSREETPINQEQTVTSKPTTSSDSSGCKILVVCKGDTFSQTVVDYAVSMAAKTGSGLIALNLNERGHDFSGFCSKSEQNVAEFSCKASEAGILFDHLVRQGAENHVVAQLHAENAGLRYVMDDIASASPSSQVIPVYTRATIRAR